MIVYESTLEHETEVRFLFTHFSNNNPQLYIDEKQGTCLVSEIDIKNAMFYNNLQYSF